ncbi:MAG TPA: hypothetical protein DDZ88_21890 [Verrucomicrobiales bacterium]|nr:hypothetical protein [Verrucomicrobiales bacterium]
MILVVHPSLPVQKVQDLIALAKSKPLVYGSAGNGSGGHLSGELLHRWRKSMRRTCRTRVQVRRRLI